MEITPKFPPVEINLNITVSSDIGAKVSESLPGSSANLPAPDTMANRVNNRIVLDPKVSAMPGVSKTVKHIYGVRSLLAEVAKDFDRRRAEHDASKLEEPQLSGFSKYADMPPHGTPEYEARLEEMHEVILLHYKACDHHPEHYALYADEEDPTRKELESTVREGDAIMRMPMPAQIEMLCDWKDRAGDKFWDSWDYNMARFGIGVELRTVLKATAEYYGF